MACDPPFTGKDAEAAKPGLGDLFRPGGDLEARVAMIAEEMGHAVIVFDPGNPNSPGFDVVSIDTLTGTFHIWEAKHVKGSVGMHDLSALNNAFGAASSAQLKANATPEEAREAGRDHGEKMWKGLIEFFPSPILQENVKQAFNEGKVEWHLVGGPETTFTAEVKAAFSGPNFHITYEG